MEWNNLLINWKKHFIQRLFIYIETKSLKNVKEINLNYKKIIICATYLVTCDGYLSPTKCHKAQKLSRICRDYFEVLWKKTFEVAHVQSNNNYFVRFRIKQFKKKAVNGWQYNN